MTIKTPQGVINTDKITTPRQPFFSVGRDEQGRVYYCVKNGEIKCDECMFNLACSIYKKEE